MQWLTLEETCLELRLPRKTVLAMLRRGRLYGLKTGEAGGHARWRVYPPADKARQFLLEEAEHLLHVPLFTAPEVAAILGVQPATVRKFVQYGQLRPQAAGKGKASLFAAAEVRRFLWQREKKHRRGRKVYSPWLVQFLSAVLRAEAAPAVQQLESLVAQVMAYLPRAEREPLLPTFWKHLNGINEVLRRVREARSRPS